MIQSGGGIIVGVLGQWASGKTEAARTLIDHLGGKDEVVFLADRILFAGQAVNHILELDQSQVVVSIEDDGRQRLEGELATVWLEPGEDLRTVDLNTLNFDVYDEQVLCAWRSKAKVALGYQIREKASDGKPIVIEAAFGPNAEPADDNPFGRTISDFFMRIEDAGVELKQVKWIIVQAGFARRAERNQERGDIPAVYFDRFGADGGDLDLDVQRRLEEQGTLIRRVPNDHNNIDRFRAEIIAAFEEMREELV
jgi:hypothetical protein